MAFTSAAQVAAPQGRVSRFDRSTPQQRSGLRLVDHVVSARSAASAIKAQRSARIDMLAIALALTAAALVRFNVIPGIGW